jgi:hypothetical protein
MKMLYGVSNDTASPAGRSAADIAQARSSYPRTCIRRQIAPTSNTATVRSQCSTPGLGEDTTTVAFVIPGEAGRCGAAAVAAAAAVLSRASRSLTCLRSSALSSSMLARASACCRAASTATWLDARRLSAAAGSQLTPLTGGFLGAGATPGGRKALMGTWLTCARAGAAPAFRAVGAERSRLMYSSLYVANCTSFSAFSLRVSLSSRSSTDTTLSSCWLLLLRWVGAAGWGSGCTRCASNWGTGWRRVCREGAALLPCAGINR